MKQEDVTVILLCCIMSTILLIFCSVFLGPHIVVALIYLKRIANALEDKKEK